MLRTVKGCLATIILLAAVLSAIVAASAAAANRSAPASDQATPAEIQALLNLLADPKVQDWLRQQHATTGIAPPATAKPEDDAPAEMMSSRLEAVRERLADMADALPGMPAEFAYAAGQFQERFEGKRPERILTLLAGFVALGYGVQALFSRATRRIRQNLEGHPVDTVGNRVRLVAERAAFAL